MGSEMCIRDSLMGLEDRGQIQEGFFADLLIVSGNPVEDISAIANQDNHLSLFKNGVHV